MDYHATDGPQYKGDRNLFSDEMEKELSNRKSMFMKHFVLDFVDFGMQKTVTENMMYCAQKVGYFNNINATLSDQEYELLDTKYESCLGKFSDSFEIGLDAVNDYMIKNKKQTYVSHSQELDPSKKREQGYFMGQDTTEPIYN